MRGRCWRGGVTALWPTAPAARRTQHGSSASPPPAWVAALRQAADGDRVHSISYELAFHPDDRCRREPFAFDPKTWDAIDLPETVRAKLCLEDPDHEYCLIGEGFTFPDNNDNPVVNSPDVPARFWWDPASTVPKVLIQLAPAFPPALWLPVKPEYAALKRVFSEFLTADAHMLRRHLPYYEALQQQMEAKAGTTLSKIQPERMRDLIVDDRRRVDPASVSPDWERTSRVYLGVVDYYQQAEASFLNNPFVFAWPVMLGHENHHQLDSSVKLSVFRTVYSRSMLFIQGREDLQVDPTAPAEHQFAMHVPLFATVNYPANQRMCGGSALVRRFNTLFGTEHALDTPVDVLAACLGNVARGPAALAADLDALAKALGGAGALTPREADECAASASLLITHLAVLRAPDWQRDVLERFCFSDRGAIRIACAKGAAELGLTAALGDLARRERDPRVRLLMEHLLRSGDPNTPGPGPLPAPRHEATP